MACCLEPLMAIINGMNPPSAGKPVSQKKLPGTAVDPEATKETYYLFKNMQTKLTDKVMFGHQDTSACGVGWKGNDKMSGSSTKSDIKDVAGDFPAVYGWDLGADGALSELNLDGVPFKEMKKWIKEAYARGGLNTISMHLDNPVTRWHKSAWDTTPAVSKILPGGERHKDFLKTLDGVAAFLKDLRAEDGTFIPIVFRILHEYNQKWSWWQKEACSADEFQKLWEMVVTYFRDTCHIHHVLYAMAPQDCKTQDEYLERYPGDDWVDVMGLDWYMLKAESGSAGWLGKILSMIGKLAEEKGKACALTEVGFGTKVPAADWWTTGLLGALKHDEYSKRMAFALVWRNASADRHFAAYPKSESADDFKTFHKDPVMMFNRDVSKIGLFS